MKVYYVVYIRGEVIADCLNAILCLIKPKTKHRAHITVRGPYTQEIDIELLNKQAWGIHLMLDGVGRFTNPGQHVVYLSCNAPKLERIWWKPNYSFVPHLTLYNGTSQEQADEIFDIANQYTYRLFFKAVKLEPFIIGGQRSHLRPISFNEDNISAIAQERISHQTIITLSCRQKLNAINTILRNLSYISDVYPHDTIGLTWKNWEEFWKKQIS